MTTLTLSPVGCRASALRIRPSLSPHWDSRSLATSQLVALAIPDLPNIGTIYLTLT